MKTRYRNGHKDWEKNVLDSLSQNEPEALIDKFSTLVRSSGKEDERIAANYIVERLKYHGISHQVFEPTLYISLPSKSSLQVEGSGGWEDIKCASPSFSASTDPDWLEGVGAVTKAAPRGKGDYVFDDTVIDPSADVTGKIAFCEGIFSPAMVRTLEDMGAVGVVMINPGERIHESNCSTVWGTPTLENMHQLPGIPVVSIIKSDGDRLRKMVRESGLKLRIQTEMDAGWRKCPLVVAEIKGCDDPDSFILIHGHLDGWHFGVCDNATGNASLLELARIFYEARDGLGRSVRVAWWPGHSHGRYAGSTWYSDNFGIDIEENCIASINIDSPGSRWATSYGGIMMMDEAAPFCTQAIYDAVGQKVNGSRPQRAGDYSFNNIGVTSMFMLMSAIPNEVREEKGFYKVGGNGGNAITWHTKEDGKEYVDYDILVKDLTVLATAIGRLANALMLPYDFRKTAESHRERLRQYQDLAGDRFNLNPAIQGIDSLSKRLDVFYKEALKSLQATSGARVIEMKSFNEDLLALARILIPIDYVNMARFEHDPAVPIPSLGRFAPIGDLAALDRDPHLHNITVNTLTRRRNQIVSAYRGLIRRLEAR